jgi:hypothetical protein
MGMSDFKPNTMYWWFTDKENMVGHHEIETDATDEELRYILDRCDYEGGFFRTNERGKIYKMLDNKEKWDGSHI